MSLVDQTRLSISTNLKIGLYEYVSSPRTRAAMLTSYAQSMAKAAGRKGAGVAIDDGGSGYDVRIKDGKIVLSGEYLRKVDEWAQDIDQGHAAVFGTIARVVAKQTGRLQTDLAVSGVKAGLGYLEHDPELHQAAVESFAAYISTLANIRKIQEEFPGLGGAIAASFIANAQCPAPAEMFGSKSDRDRWRAVWSTLIMECLSPIRVPDTVYPDEETQNTVKGCAELLASTVDTYGHISPKNCTLMADSLKGLFEHPEDDEEDENEEDSGEGEGDEEGDEQEGGSEGSAANGEGGGGNVEGSAGDTEGVQQLSAALSSDEESVALAPSSPTDDLPTSQILTPMDQRTRIIVYAPLQRRNVVKDSPLTARMREYLTDTRMEQYNGQQAGRVTPQLHRLTTDGRIFGRRKRVPDPIESCVVICVDVSGSMHGAELESASRLHDALVYSLDQLDIPYASCAYDGDGSTQEFIYPINEMGSLLPPLSIDPVDGRNSWVGGNGDQAAMVWSTKQVEESRKGQGAVVFLADGQFTHITPATFQRRARELELNIFHVDYIDNRVSPFGGTHLKAMRLSVDQIAEPLARGLAECLGIE